MKEKIIQFTKDFIFIAILISIIELIFYKLNIINEFNFSYNIGFMTGWSIWQLIKLWINSKKQK